MANGLKPISHSGGDVVLKDFSIGIVLFLVVLGGGAIAYNLYGSAFGLAEPGVLKVDQKELLLPSKRYSKSYKERSGKFAKAAFEFDGQERNYHYFEGGDDADRPLIVLLHGSKRTGASVIDMWQSQANKTGALLVAPDSFSKSGWDFKKDPAKLINKLIEVVSQSHSFDKNRVFLFGHSSGAVYAGFLSIQEDAPFAAVTAHAGYPHAGLLREFGGVIDDEVPVQFLLGTDDHIFNTVGATDAANYLSETGKDINLVLLEGHTHWYYSAANEINKMAFEFFEANANQP